ncbi:uncharacterized protein ARMOST_22491 [Armillaria ostoyae]|uniref:Catalase core domain-containing protein n=1 Tax=Armillaria ostoyae TaxID=47428 RepID=A0A284SD20_ARMOS|nr:uncharacterized protein ARMOST_22491 [Armillaria ostoyae]
MTFAASNGASIAQPYALSQAGPSGPLLLQDFASIDLLTHFDHECIPERIVLLGDGIICSLKHWVRIDGARDKARAMVSRVGGWLY